MRDYLGALQRLMIVEDQRPWSPHLRSKSRLRNVVKRHFVDPSLAVAALRATPELLLTDLNLFGFLSSNRWLLGISASTPKHSTAKCFSTATTPA